MEAKFGFKKNDIIEYAGEKFEVLNISRFNNGGTVAEWHGGMQGDIVPNFLFSVYGEDATLVMKAEDIGTPIANVKALKTFSHGDFVVTEECFYKLFKDGNGDTYIYDDNTIKSVLTDSLIQENFRLYELNF
ncbi:hypothetical protein [Bacillus cereus group sp. BfR-BA-01328]|uniref:hypothetical protein n=1 Tax=Bacillus cereus group sp. BfR-BA-01328 TaxID=2920304 RepID=UPI001F57DE9C